MNIARIMIPKVSTVFLHENNTVRQGLELITHHGYSALPVLSSEGVYIGSVSEGDFLRHILSAGTTDLKAHERCRIGSLVRRDFCPPLSIEAEDSLVISTILNQNFVPIVDDRGALCGILTRRAVIASLAEENGVSKIPARSPAQLDSLLQQNGTARR